MLFICICTHTCNRHMCVYVCVCVCVCVRTCMTPCIHPLCACEDHRTSFRRQFVLQCGCCWLKSGSRSWKQIPMSTHLHFFFLTCSWNSELINWADLAGQWALAICQSLPPQRRDDGRWFAALAFYTGAGIWTPTSCLHNKPSPSYMDLPSGHL